MGEGDIQGHAGSYLSLGSGEVVREGGVGWKEGLQKALLGEGQRAQGQGAGE